MACAVASCDYLDIVPDGTPTEKDAFANQGTTEGYLYSCYGFIPNNGNCLLYTSPSPRDRG